LAQFIRQRGDHKAPTQYYQDRGDHQEEYRDEEDVLPDRVYRGIFEFLVAVSYQVRIANRSRQERRRIQIHLSRYLLAFY
jgi:hypothetical protein